MWVRGGAEDEQQPAVFEPRECFLMCVCWCVSFELDFFIGDILGMMRVSQQQNQVGDSGAFGLGEGLKVNGCLTKLYLVSSFIHLL